MIGAVPDLGAAAWFGGRLASDLVEVSHDPADLDRPGWWALAMISSLTQLRRVRRERAVGIGGSGGRVRTCDPAINSRLLYR